MLLQPNEIRSMTAQAVRRLVEAGDGDAALLYLALLEWNDCSRAQRALHWGDGQTNAVYGRLVRLELAAPQSAPTPRREEPAEEIPRYTTEDIAGAMESQPEFCGLYREVENRLGRPLSHVDLETLYGVYDGLALPAEVILLLVSYMLHKVRQTGGAAAVPRMSQIKTEAYRWKRRGLETPEAVEQYLRLQQQVESREWEILSAVGVVEFRRAVTDERKFIESWVEMGFSAALIALAYERTIYQKGKMNWPYLNKILLAWHQSGWRTPEQVKAEDKPARRAAPAAAPKGQTDYQPTADRIRESGDWLDEFLQNEKKGE